MKQRSIFTIATICLALCLAVGCTENKTTAVTSAVSETATSGTDEKALEQLMTELKLALQTGNASALENIYADSYSFTGVDGAVTTKGQRIDAVRSGKLKYQSLTFANMNIRLYGDAAVITFDGDARFAPGNEQLDGKFRTTATFIKSNGRWMQVASGNVRTGN